MSVWAFGWMAAPFGMDFDSGLVGTGWRCLAAWCPIGVCRLDFPLPHMIEFGVAPSWFRFHDGCLGSFGGCLGSLLVAILIPRTL